MKSLITLLFLLVSALLANAANIEKLFFSLLQAGSKTTTSSYVNSHNPYGFSLPDSIVSTDFASKKRNQKHTFEYNAKGEMTAEMLHKINTSTPHLNYWEWYEATDFTYTANGEIETVIYSQVYKEARDLRNKMVVEYENGKLKQSILYAWNYQNNSWDFASKLIYEYPDAHTITIQGLNYNSQQGWYAYMNKVLTLNDIGLEIDSKTYYNEILYYAITTVYDSNNNMISQTQSNYSYSTGQMLQSNKDGYIYNADKSLQSHTFYTYDQEKGVWLQCELDTYSYDDNKNLTSHIFHGWNFDENLWYVITSHKYYYPSLSSLETSLSSPLLVYSSNGNIIIEENNSLENIQIFSISGMLTAATKAPSAVFSVSPGVYVVRVNSQSKKIIVQ